MPVTFHNMNVTKTLQQVGVNATLLAKMTSMGITPELAATELKFVSAKIGKLGVVGTFPVSSSSLMAAAKGNMGILDKNLLIKNLNNFLSQITASETPAAPPTPEKQPAKPVTFKEPGLAEKPEPAQKPHSAPIGDLGSYSYLLPALKQHQPFNLALWETTPALPLVDANGLYFPVRGTDANSVYFLVGVYENCKVGARLKGNKLSIRIEGQLSPHQVAAIQSLGFGSSNDKHWSVHLMLNDVMEAQRCMGTVLSSLGGLLTPLPTMGLIAGKGK